MGPKKNDFEIKLPNHQSPNNVFLKFRKISVCRLAALPGVLSSEVLAQVFWGKARDQTHGPGIKPSRARLVETFYLFFFLSVSAHHLNILHIL